MFVTTSPDGPSLRRRRYRLANVIARDPLTETMERAESATAAACERKQAPPKRLSGLPGHTHKPPMRTKSRPTRMLSMGAIPPRRGTAGPQRWPVRTRWSPAAQPRKREPWPGGSIWIHSRIEARAPDGGLASEPACCAAESASATTGRSSIPCPSRQHGRSCVAQDWRRGARERRSDARSAAGNSRRNARVRFRARHLPPPGCCELHRD